MYAARSLFVVGTFAMSALFLNPSHLRADPPSTDKELARKIFDTMLQVHGTTAGFRPVHARGVVCLGTFTPSKDAAALSKAPQFQSASVPVIVRFSDGANDPNVADNAPEAGPRGMAIRFQPAGGGGETDIVAISHNGFVVATGQEFLALQQAVVATDPSKPHPWPIEQFIGSHPLALKFVTENRAIPTSFATESFFSNNAFVFVNKSGAKQPFRYQILPAEGRRVLSDADAKSKSPGFLVDDLKANLPKQPAKFRLVAQLPNPGDPTNDPSLVWPDDRKTVELGTIAVTSVAPDADAQDKALALDPTNLAPGIELSDDPLPALRSSVYALSAKHRHQK